MSELSVNEHLEGILSDFEALKRSFEIEDVDDVPSSSASPVSSPVSPSSSHFFLSHGQVSEGRGGDVPPPSLSFNNRGLVSPASHRSCAGPVLKSRPLIGSLSFNRGTANKASVHHNGSSSSSSVTRASSFQSRFHPGSLGPGSDDDSLHSSTSSLDYPPGVALSKLAPPPAPPRLLDPALKMFSSHGNVFRSEADHQGHGGVGPGGLNHGSMPSLDLRIQRGGDRRFTNAAWNGHLPNDNYAGPRTQPGSGVPKAQPRLNKFPLDLDSLVTVTTPQRGPADASPPKPPLRATPPTAHFSPYSPPPSPSPGHPRSERLLSGTGRTPPPLGAVPSAEVCDVRESVGSILQRIASFTRPEINPTTPSRNRKIHEETAGEPEPLVPMEDGEDARGQEHTEEDTGSQEESRVCRAMEEEEEEEMEEEGGMAKDTESVPGRTSFIRGSDLFGYVGIEAVLDQMRRKTMKAGFEFNIMVVGQSGLGKSTLVNTLFKSKVSRKSCTANYSEEISKTVRLHAVSHVIEEKGVKMKLTVIDTPGFGDQINNNNCWEPIVTYVNEQYEKFLREELHVNRKRRIPDSRVHCCIYFLPATGHRLRPIDVEFMKRLGRIVSIVPVIAKSDTLTMEERQEFKERIRQDLAANGIQVYPQKEFDEDPEEHVINDRIRDNIPFAVVGTDKEHQVNGNKVLGRKTKWGIIEVENVAHCEFANLRDLLIRSHLQDLKDVTHNIHYETYRVRRLNESNVTFGDPGRLENGTADKYESASHL